MVFKDISEFGYFAKWHINCRRLFDAKAILPEEQQGYYLT